jgi:tRNA (adenine37-N6)-methyltransferase
MQNSWIVRPIGSVKSPRKEPVDDNWGEIESTIELNSSLDSSSLDGIEEFSHAEVVYVFHRVKEDSICYGKRRPRDNLAWPEVGIFAQRAKNRPNRIGVSVCELIERKEMSLKVRGLDAIDGTPVLDIKPWFSELIPATPNRKPRWVKELMADYF